MAQHDFVQPMLLQFLQVLTVREVRVSLAERFAPSKAVQADVTSLSLLSLILAVDLVIVPCFLSVLLQIILSLKLCKNFAL